MDQDPIALGVSGFVRHVFEGGGAVSCLWFSYLHTVITTVGVADVLNSVGDVTHVKEEWVCSGFEDQQSVDRK